MPGQCAVVTGANSGIGESQAGMSAHQPLPLTLLHAYIQAESLLQGCMPKAWMWSWPAETWKSASTAELTYSRQAMQM